MKNSEMFMKIIRKSLTMMAALLVMALVMVPAASSKAATAVDVEVTICKGTSAGLLLTGDFSQYKVKWSLSANEYTKISKSYIDGNNAVCIVDGLKNTSGRLVRAKVYNSKGTLVRTFVYRVVVKSHTYKVTREATCQKEGEKVCTRCDKKLSIAKLKHTYRWVRSGPTSTVKLANTEIDTYKSIKLTSDGKWKQKDQRITNSIDLRDKYGTPYSHVITKFTNPLPTKVKSQGKISFDIKTWTEKVHNTETHFAQGGTVSGCEILSRKMTNTETKKFITKQIKPDDVVTIKFDNVKGGGDVSRWYSHWYSNGMFGRTWENTYEATMPSGKVGEKRYVLMFSSAAFRWFTYTYKATCH